jgi:hypothetical protein
MREDLCRQGRTDEGGSLQTREDLCGQGRIFSDKDKGGFGQIKEDLCRQWRIPREGRCFHRRVDVSTGGRMFPLEGRYFHGV